MSEVSRGALVGWRRIPMPGGTAICLQFATSEQSKADHDYETVTLSINDRRLRSLARDLLRASLERGFRTGWLDVVIRDLFGGIRRHRSPG